MAFKKWISLALGAMLLSGCSGMANLYGEPAANFKAAVDHTTVLVAQYEKLERTMLVSGQVDELSSSADARLAFNVADCAKTPVGPGCAVATQSSSQPIVPPKPDTQSEPHPMLALMAKMQDYANTLNAIATATTADELNETGQALSKSYNDLLQSVRTNSQDAGALDPLKGLNPMDVVIDSAASMYLEKKRVEYLLRLVEAGDPVVSAVSTTMQSVVADIRSDYVRTKSGRINNSMLRFMALGAELKNKSPLQTRQARSIRQQLLIGALQDQHDLHVVAANDAAAAFAKMSVAHKALLKALQLADSSEGLKETALLNLKKVLGDFTQASMEAAQSMATVKMGY